MSQYSLSVWCLQRSVILETIFKKFCLKEKIWKINGKKLEKTPKKPSVKFSTDHSLSYKGAFFLSSNAHNHYSSSL